MQLPVNKPVINNQDDVFFCRSGYEVKLNDDIWILDKNTSINFGRITAKISTNQLIAVKNVLRYYAISNSPSHCNNLYNRFLHYVSYGGNEITTASLINYRSTLGKEYAWYLGSIKGFLKKWYDLGYDGVAKEIVDLLDSWTLKGNIKGDVVKRLDPEEGPLSDIELIAFNEGAVQSFEKALISLDELSMSLMASGTGRREIQISHMRLKDVLQGQNHKNEAAYILNIPKAKQRGATFRSSFNQLQITEELWTILNMQSNAVKKRFSEHFKTTIPSHILIELPLFPDYQLLNEVDSVRKLESLLSVDVLHIASKTVTVSVKKIVQVANIYSERTGELLKMTSRRFRYTTGTRAAREGFGVLIIAELLDHSDTQNAHVYVENVPEYAARINEKMSHLLAPYAKAFQGCVVSSEADAIRGQDINSRIRLNPHENIGTCGNYDFCGSRVPVPCYTCNHFQPWIDAPHQKILDELITERDRIASVTGDLAIASANDRTILAVAEVIQRCKTHRQELNHD